ncbi:MAG: glycosyltransferase [Proteobacteria bacterium]|nr:glycosyltransferase [Pseudomonadota bacterium]
MPKISVVTCLWNSMQYWPSFYKTLMKTSAQIDELIVVDNGSEDGAKDIVPKTDSDIIFIRHEENTFEGDGVRAAMEAATGDLVFKCDPDITFLTNQWQEHFIRGLSFPDVGAVLGLPYGWPMITHKEVGFTEGSVLVGTLFLLPRSTIDKCGVWDPDLKYGVNEWDYALRMRREGLKIAICPLRVMNHFTHHARMRQIGKFDVGPLIGESWAKFAEKRPEISAENGGYWAAEENQRFEAPPSPKDQAQKILTVDKGAPG